MIVKKVTDTELCEKARKDWLAYWRHFNHQPEGFCNEINCLNHATEAVLVACEATREQDGRLFVVPLCQAHSDNFSGYLEIADETELLPYDLTL